MKCLWPYRHNFGWNSVAEPMQPPLPPARKNAPGKAQEASLVVFGKAIPVTQLVFGGVVHVIKSYAGSDKELELNEV